MAVRFPSELFTTGRACPLTSVVLHEYKSGLEMLDKEMNRCIRPRPQCSPNCHTSFHYGVGNCHLHQYVDIANTAWGFWFEPTPVCPEPPCPIVQECDGLGADQFNPDFDGNPSTPATSTAGVCLDANCSVIHVAVITGVATISDGIYCIGAPTFSENAYSCLVQSLCEIFDAADLTPVSGTTLLTHIGELVNLDVDQLALDILLCLNAPTPPLPPCDCEIEQTPITAQSSPTVNLIASGTDDHTLIANVNVSTANGNQLSSLGDGLFVSPQTPITANNTQSITLSASGTDNHTLAANAVISPTAGNQLVLQPNGLFVAPATAYTKCGADPLLPTDNVVTSESFEAAGTTTIAVGIYAQTTDEPCPKALRSEACSDELMDVDVVLGSNSILGGIPTWGRPVRSTIRTATFDEQFPNLDLNSFPTDVYEYIGTSNFTVNLITPSVPCARSDLWVKNRSGFVLTISTAGAELIDGQASISLHPTVTGGYPLGDNGGEAVHLVWNGVNWLISSAYNIASKAQSFASNTSFTFIHNLNVSFPIVEVYDAGTGLQIQPNTIDGSLPNQVTVTTLAPTAVRIRVSK